MSFPLPRLPELALESKLAFLRQPTSFPDHPYRVEAIETHMSWVFLTERFAYKLKKPVCLEALDFRSIEARRHYCEEEVRLNRRLAREVYLGVVAIAMNAVGHLRLCKADISSEGETIVDWLVQMRRLPAQHMLDYAIKSGTVGDDDMGRVAARLALFYRSCAPVPVSAAAYRAALLRDIDRNEQVLTRPVAGLPERSIRELCAMQRAVVNQQPEWLDGRVRAGKIVEGHGDLRPEHVCLKPEVMVIDCLEFSSTLRTIDPLDEVAYLALECGRLGSPNAGAFLLNAYGEFSGDPPPTNLVNFYQGFRAVLRARLAIAHLDEEKFRHSEEWHRRAKSYLRLAERCQKALNAVTDPPV